jgi:hypothetical protein
MTAVEFLFDELSKLYDFQRILDEINENSNKDVFEQALEMERLQDSDKYKSVTRFEVIDHSKEFKGRFYVKKNCKIELQLQDDSKTLKVFVND